MARVLYGASLECGVSFEYDNASKAKSVIQEKIHITDITQISDHEIEVNISKNRVPELCKCLVDSGLAIHAIEPKRKLEDYFMKIIEA